jgi:hypothetical protein
MTVLEDDLGYHGNKIVRYIQRSLNHRRFYIPVQPGINTDHKFHGRNSIYWQQVVVFRLIIQTEHAIQWSSLSLRIQRYQISHAQLSISIYFILLTTMCIGYIQFLYLVFLILFR